MLSVSAFGSADNTSSHSSLPTLIIPDITKTSSNNCLLLDEAEYDIQNYADQRDFCHSFKIIYAYLDQC